ncbi:protein saal1 [Sabethes cyaneus]|uniref:protein saal1 n=1 Tax=Sabethes cyaneus TaxID=53552 RepID=UPI00237D518C|nr:protein saal1 [Sabethes cyaneus]
MKASDEEQKPKEESQPVMESAAVQPTNYEQEDDQPEQDGILEKLKGDRIGETMYSERFVLTTILKLPQLKTSLADDEDFEKDLCSLWDMTIEKDVVLFLLKHDVVELFVGLSENSQDYRLMEILFGIIGNMCCVDETHKCLYENKSLLMSLCAFLESSDTLVLVQLMRIITSLLDRSDDEQYCWFKLFREIEGMTDKLGFILSSTTNKELIEHTVEAVHAMVNRFTEAEVDYAQLNEFYSIFAKPSLIEGLMEGFKQVYPETAAENKFEEEYLTSKDLKTIQKFLEIHENLIINANEAYTNYVEKIVYCMWRVLVPLSGESSLLPLSKMHVRIFVSINSIYSAIVYHFHAETFLALVKIYTLLSKEQEAIQKNATNQESSTADDKEETEDCEFDIQTALGEILETLYFTAEPIDLSTIENTWKASCFSEPIVERLCSAIRGTMAGDPLLERTCNLLMEGARNVWSKKDRS